MYIFEISIKDGFLIPHLTYSKKKSFHRKEESMCSFYELKVKIAGNYSIFHKTVVFETGLRVSTSFQNFMPDIWASKSMVPAVHCTVYTDKKEN